MFEWFIEVILILVILVQYLFSKKSAELEPSESHETSRDIVVCKWARSGTTRIVATSSILPNM